MKGYCCTRVRLALLSRERRKGTYCSPRVPRANRPSRGNEAHLRVILKAGFGSFTSLFKYDCCVYGNPFPIPTSSKMLRNFFLWCVHTAVRDTHSIVRESDTRVMDFFWALRSCSLSCALRAPFTLKHAYVAICPTYMITCVWVTSDAELSVVS